jgi:cell division protein FtsB
MKLKSILKVIKFFNLSLIIFLSILTVFQIGIFTSRVYSLKEGERKIEKLSKENQILEEKLLSSNSPSKVDEIVKKENLVKAGKIKFIQIFGGAVLAK